VPRHCNGEVLHKWPGREPLRLTRCCLSGILLMYDLSA
jgi:hypothetical protein